MIKKLLKEFEFLYVNRCFPSHERKRRFLIKQGARIGKGTRFNCYTSAFGSEPYLVEVGQDCLFAFGTYFVTHDGGIKVLNSLKKFGSQQMLKMAPIKVGNNVYTGMYAMIMPGVTIGNNVIIGAHAVVTHDIPDNSVAVGIPARVVCSIEDYYQRCTGRVDSTKDFSYQEKKDYYLKKFKI